MNDALLETVDLNVSIAGKTILHEINLDFLPGKFYGLVGPNGSGKSTILKTLARQLPPSGGAVLLDGAPLNAIKTRDFARIFAYMPQFTPIADGMTVRQLISLGRFPWHGTLGRFTGADRDFVEEAIRRTDLLSLADLAVAELSGGERQRAWIAMMLAQNARCLLFDEPTSALDLAHQASILSLIHELTREGKFTAIAILHDINLAARYCDEIIALGKGRIIARGEPVAIMRDDALRTIFGVEMGIFSHPTTGQPVSYLR